MEAWKGGEGKGIYNTSSLTENKTKSVDSIFEGMWLNKTGNKLLRQT